VLTSLPESFRAVASLSPLPRRTRENGYVRAEPNQAEIISLNPSEDASAR